MTNVPTAYREVDAQGASGVRLVVLMYEQMIQDLRHAARAMEENNVEYRTDRINHVLDVLCVLEGTLNFERGGQVARNLRNFYKALRANLWKAQLTQSKELLMRQITDLFALRDAWAEVDRAESGGPAPSVVQTVRTEPPAISDERVSVSWKA